MLTVVTALWWWAAALEPTRLDPRAIAAEQSLRFRLEYEFEIEPPAGAQSLRLWVPLPRRDAVQQAELTELDAPGPVKFTRDREYGNRMAYSALELNGGLRPLRWRLVHTITRRQWHSPVPPTREEPDAPAARYLRSDRLVPSDGFIASIGPDLLESEIAVSQRVQQLYRYCMDQLEYRKEGIGWGRGDVQWVCDNRYGNCSDFHSLFIALCRSRGVPAKFEIGLPIPYTGRNGDIAGYHCWAKFLDTQTGWFAVDISEAEKHPELTDYFFGRLSARRVHFSTGRDIVLEPPQQGPPVNFLVYPYAEIDGQELEVAHRRFSFEMLPPETP